MSRFFSILSIYGLLVVAAAPGCYAFGGSPVIEGDSERLLEQAHAACERGDVDAFKMLRGRLAEDDPGALQSKPAQELDARCAKKLHSSPRIGTPDSSAPTPDSPGAR